jgi:hypothetical protein
MSHPTEKNLWQCSLQKKCQLNLEYASVHNTTKDRSATLSNGTQHINLNCLGTLLMMATPHMKKPTHRMKQAGTLDERHSVQGQLKKKNEMRLNT